MDELENKMNLAEAKGLGIRIIATAMANKLERIWDQTSPMQLSICMMASPSFPGDSPRFRIEAQWQHGNDNHKICSDAMVFGDDVYARQFPVILDRLVESVLLKQKELSEQS